jgi:hypothetical protein
LCMRCCGTATWHVLTQGCPAQFKCWLSIRPIRSWGALGAGLMLCYCVVEPASVGFTFRVDSLAVMTVYSQQDGAAVLRRIVAPLMVDLQPCTHKNCLYGISNCA